MPDTTPGLLRIIVRYALLTLSLSAILIICYLWLTFVSPFFYQNTGEQAVIDEQASYRVFVYGTLTKPWVRWLVMGRAAESTTARLPGFRKDALDIHPQVGATTDGQVITVTGAELKALDRYERLGVRYKRIKLVLENGDAVWVYKRITPALPGLALNPVG